MYMVRLDTKVLEKHYREMQKALLCKICGKTVTVVILNGKVLPMCDCPKTPLPDKEEHK